MKYASIMRYKSLFCKKLLGKAPKRMSFLQYLTPAILKHVCHCTQLIADFSTKSTIFAPIMTREELIFDCRYYNGEDEVPDSLPEGKAIFWDYERVWTGWVLEGCDRLQININHYSKVYDLPNLLPESDGTPLGLKALLFNRYEHWNCFMGGSIEKYAQRFKEWYFDQYVAGTKTHRQLLDRQQADDAHT